MSEPEPKPGDDKPDTQKDTAKLQTHDVAQRRSRWLSSLAALRYVSGVQKDNEIKVRDSDKATAISLLLCCAAALVCLVVPGFEAYRVTFVLAADVLVGISLLAYVANRFGIVTTFLPRQALLTWQLMLGSSLLGIFLTINLAMIIASVIQNTKIIIPP
jgi:MFS family permease